MRIVFLKNMTNARMCGILNVSNEREVKEMTLNRLEKEVMDVIVTYMDDEIREQVHAELAPCTNDEFVKRYCELDEEFEELLYNEFGLRAE